MHSAGVQHEQWRIAQRPGGQRASVKFRHYLQATCTLLRGIHISLSLGALAQEIEAEVMLHALG